MLRAQTVALALLAGAVVFVPLAIWLPNLVELFVVGESRELEHEQHRPAAIRSHSKILFIGMDGVGRDLLYEELREGRLPELAALLGGQAADGEFPHAHLDETLLSTLPSTTMAAWATTMTGVAPAEHGVTGNEFFIRESRTLAAPAPVTLSDSSPTLRIYTDGYANSLVLRQTVWERLRQAQPGIVIWSSMLPYYAGADRLLMAKRAVLATTFEAFLASATDGHSSMRDVYAELDEEAIETVVEELGSSTPDVLAMYLPGIDLYAHHAEQGPDAARRGYLREVIDPELAELHQRLASEDAHENRWIVVTSDHGHTDVVHDDAHALSTEGDDEPPHVLRQAGFRVRPFQLELDDDADFQSVLAYQGAIAFVYLADRSTCPAPGQACDWSRPPRYEEDVLVAASAFFAASHRGAGVPALRDTLHLVLARRPKPVAETDEPFEVYTGDGSLMNVEEYMSLHPEPRYVELPSRLSELAVGPHGERAGDVLLLAHNGDRDRRAERYYFAPPYRSWHGSPSRRDSEIPLILARPGRSQRELAAIARAALGAAPRQQRVTDLLLALPP